MPDTHVHVAQHATPVIEPIDPDLLVVSHVTVGAGEVITDRDDPTDPAVIVVSIEGHNATGEVTHRLALRPSDAHTLALQVAMALKMGNPRPR